MFPGWVVDIVNPVEALLAYFAAWKCRRKCIAHPTTRFARQSRVSNPMDRGAITIGAESLCMGQFLVIPSGGRIAIGDWCYIGPDSKVWAMDEVKIGSRVFISHGVSIFDNNSHSFSAEERHDRYRELLKLGSHQVPEKVVHRPVTIEDDVWIGFSSAILKGVTVGKGAIVGACSVVTHDVEPYSIVVGNPARQVGTSRP